MGVRSAQVTYFGREQKPLKNICLDWQFLSSVSTAGSRRDPVGPFEVRSGSPFVQEIEFFPRRKTNPDGTTASGNFFHFREMERLIAQGEVQEIVLNFEAEIVGQENRLTVACKVPVDSDFLNNAGTTRFALYSRECTSAPAVRQQCG